MANTISGVITRTVRKGNTANGNPIFDVTLATPTQGFPGVVTLRVSHDSALSYDVENMAHSGKPYLFALTRAGRLSHDIAPIEP